jgi:predicted TIM-barrel fold metal-dependent hydrolase
MRVLNRARVDGIREFPRKPSEYFASNVWVQGHTETLDWENLFAVGIDNVMWGSDFPHAEGSWPDSRDWIQKRQSEFKLARADLDKYLSVNAAKVYGFDLDVLRPIGERIGPDIAG